MRSDLVSIEEAISSASLPTGFLELFGSSWDPTNNRFVSQETYIIDYKDKIPPKFSDPYGASIIKLVISFHNAYGGLVVFGVKDRILVPLGPVGVFDIESFNRVVSDFTGVSIECVCRNYKIPETEYELCVLLVPRRRTARPVRLTKKLSNLKTETVWIRDRHECLEAASRHLPILYSSRDRIPNDQSDFATFPVHRSLPPSPATMKDFIQRGPLLEDLWDWLVFSDRPRLYLYGPGGSGKSTLAFEFAKLLSEYGQYIRFVNGERFDYIVFISGKETEFNVHSLRQQNFVLRQFVNATEQFSQILYHSGLLDLELINGDDSGEIDSLLDEMFSIYNGLIVIDDIDALSRRKVDTGEEVLFLKAVKSNKRNKILYTLRNAPAYALGSSIAVPGLSEKEELSDFIDLCCHEFKVAKPSVEHVPLIKNETASLPLLIETVVGLRRCTSGYPQALETFKQKGGDEARRYLYQREYDGLPQNNNARYVLGHVDEVDSQIS